MAGHQGLALLARIALGAAAAAALPSSVVLNNGVEMPLMSLGTAEYNNSALQEAIVTAVSIGFRGLDTAFNYYNQVSVGKGVQQVGRSKVFLITKTTPCFHPQARPHYNISDVEACRKQTAADIDSDLQQLAVEQVDLLLLHGANHYGSGECGEEACQLNKVQWSVYEEALRQGKARAIGISNFCPSCISCLLEGASVVPAVNQVQFHVGMTADPEGVISASQRLGITPMAYTPLGHGEFFTDALLTEIGSKHSKSAAQVALAWIVGKGIPLATASSSQKHLAEDIDVVQWRLSAEEEKQIDAYSKGSDKPSWACTAQAQGQELLV